MSEQNAAHARRWFEEVWNQGREQTIDEMLTAEGVGHGLGDTDRDTRGPAEFKVFWRNLRGALPDVHIRVDDLISQGDRVVTRITLTGTHSGEGLGVPPSGAKVHVQGIVIMRFHNGKAVEAWNSYDQLGLLRQIGALPGTANRERDTFLSASHG